MEINLEEILELVREIDSEDPIDWGMLRIDEQSATRVIVSSLVDQYNRNWVKLSEQDRDRAMLATIAKLVVENFVLSVKLRS